MIFGGLGLDVLYIVLSGLFTRYLLQVDSAPGLLLAAVPASVLPLPVGIGFALAGRTPTQRGLGIGAVVGWSLWLIVGAGLCVASLRSLDG